MDGRKSPPPQTGEEEEENLAADEGPGDGIGGGVELRPRSNPTLLQFESRIPGAGSVQDVDIRLRGPRRLTNQVSQQRLSWY